MMRRLLMVLALAASLPGCFKDFQVELSLRDRAAEKTPAAVPPVSPDQVQATNAHQIAESLWDEIDRDAAQRR